MTMWTIARIVWFGVCHLALATTVFWITWLGTCIFLLDFIGNEQWYSDMAFDAISLLGVMFGFLTGGAYFRWVVNQMKQIDWDEIP